MVATVAERRSRNLPSVPRGVIVTVVVAAVVLVGLIVTKKVADGAATTAHEERVAELTEILEGAGPRDFLAFNSGRRVEGSIAARVAAMENFVSVDARSARAVIRVEPRGWWQGFTERCVVAVVSDDGVSFDTPSTACVRVEPSEY